MMEVDNGQYLTKLQNTKLYKKYQTSEWTTSIILYFWQIDEETCPQNAQQYWEMNSKYYLKNWIIAYNLQIFHSFDWLR